MMQQQSLIELAKQGDAKAIATLINRHLQPKGILAKAALKESCLQIILEAESLPPQQELVGYIWNAMTKLGASSIQKVKIYGKQSDSDFPTWDQEFKLQLASQISHPQIPSAESRPIESKSSLSIASDKILIECHGTACALIVKQSGVVIRRLGGFLSVHAKGDRFVSYDDILNMQFHEASFPYSFIYLRITESSPNDIKVGEAASNPDAIVFAKEKVSNFDKARILISDNIQLPSQTITVRRTEHQSVAVVHEEVQIKCPKCGSTQISANKKGFSIGQAIVGGVLTGGVGLAAGLLGGNGIRINCLRCGHRWKPRG
jgi:DNA-directed RNA polymerase subunit M/transcription elongation factor TFIIS